MKESRRGVDLDDLVKAFLFDAVPSPARKNKGSLLESGSGGRGDEKKNDGFIDEKQASILRRTNHKEYNRLVKAGKIKIKL